jgi:hypothetical protein
MFIDPEARDVVREVWSPDEGLLKANLSLVVLLVQKFLTWITKSNLYISMIRKQEDTYKTGRIKKQQVIKFMVTDSRNRSR